MYFENNPPGLMEPRSDVGKYLGTPTGYSIFPRELAIVPRAWAERIGMVVFWQDHPRGGHFAAYEKPGALASDLFRFFKPAWRLRGE